MIKLKENIDLQDLYDKGIINQILYEEFDDEKVPEYFYDTEDSDKKLTCKEVKKNIEKDKIYDEIDFIKKEAAKRNLSWIECDGYDGEPFCDGGGWGSSDPYNWEDSNGKNTSIMYLSEDEARKLIEERGYSPQRAYSEFDDEFDGDYYDEDEEDFDDEEADYYTDDNCHYPPSPGDYIAMGCDCCEWYDASKYPNCDEYDIVFVDHIAT